MLTIQYRTERMIIDASAGRGITSTPGTSSFRGGPEFTMITDILPDNDRDGIVDDEDLCPYLFGEYSFNPKTSGCPVADSDGFLDAIDACPNQEGILSYEPQFNGCPDSDGDGIFDHVDACAESEGPQHGGVQHNGCPAPELKGGEKINSARFFIHTNSHSIG